MIQVVFYLLSLVLVLAASGVVLFKNPIYSILSLIVVFFSLSSHYILLQASFIAILNIIVYAGAIMVLFLFVIMFLNLNEGSRHDKKSSIRKALGVILGGIFMILLVSVLKHNHQAITHGVVLLHVGSVKALANILFKEYKYSLLLIATLLLLATIGAVLLSTKNSENKEI